MIRGNVSKFTPRHPEKYLGDPDNITARSTWEYDVFNFCDGNQRIIGWSSEEIKIPYITPTTDTVSASNRIIVNSIYSDIPRFTTQSFTEGAIYYYNPSTKQFANVTTGYSLRRVSNYDILDGETIQTSFARNYSSFNIERVKRQLTLVNN